MITPTRRGFFRSVLASFAAGLLPKVSHSSRVETKIRHILASATDTQFSVSISFFTIQKNVTLAVNQNVIEGKQRDSAGHNWSFVVKKLTPDTNYVLQLSGASGAIGDPWNLKTFPHENSLPESFKLLAFTCAGGADGFGTPSRQFFKPHAFRQRLFDSALDEEPDAAIAIGDHVYWDLRGGSIPTVGKKSVIIKTLAGWYMKFKYGAFDRKQELLNTVNENILKRIGDEQIADLYGTRFKSTPIFFVSDDHDYFENDDPDDEIVTFPPDKFSRAAQQAMADLYYPPLPHAPSAEMDRSFGVLRYGRLFESPIFDCAGHLSLGGDDAGLVPETIEEWLLDRAKHSPATHFAFTPSHPFGWTAGKWREWYPDVIAPKGFEGVVSNELMGEAEGELSVNAEKYLWQAGWWQQHQRLLRALAQRPTSRFILSGDIHAQGAISISNSGDLDMASRPVNSFLTGPVSTSEATWPSSARGVTADTPKWLGVTPLSRTKEINGFTIFQCNSQSITASLYDCGGYDLRQGDNGSVKAVVTV